MEDSIPGRDIGMGTKRGGFSSRKKVAGTFL
jgi:hypothetical protein